MHVVADGAGDPVGFVCVWTPDAFIHHLYVDVRFRRRGCATLLLDSLHRWLPLPWRLKCVQANTLALAFYAAGGWRPAGSGEGEDGPYLMLERGHA